MNYKKCDGCIEEMNFAYELQELGLDVGFRWVDGHCYLVALDEKGRIVVE